jgi:hypothetical protein
MRIEFDLPDTFAVMLQRLTSHIREHADPGADPHKICQSLIVDILVDDATAHGAIEVECARLQ